jgi:hypothetical protein
MDDLNTELIEPRNGYKFSFDLDLNKNCSEKDCKSSRMIGSYYTSVDKFGFNLLHLDAILLT